MNLNLPNRVICVVTVFATLVLSGCQVVPDKPVAEQAVVNEATIAMRDAKLAALRPWRALGSLVVNSEASGVFNASFAWDASATGFDIRLIGPLGLKTYRVVEDYSGARFYGGDGEISGRSAQELLRQETGVNIPLLDMQDWVVGLQGNGSQTQRDSAGRLSEMIITERDQTSWRVEFQRYRQVDDLDLPKTIVVSGEDVEIRVSVRKWTKPDVVANDRLIIPGVKS